jgi:putative transposase
MSGRKIENPRFFRSGEKELARVQRNLTKIPKRTPEKKKALKVVGRVQEWIANLSIGFRQQS